MSGEAVFAGREGVLRWVLLVPVALALAAAAVSTRAGQGPPHNVVLWLPAVVAAVSLLAESTGGAAALLAGSAFFPLTASIGMWYAPALAVMAYTAAQSGRLRA